MKSSVLKADETLANKLLNDFLQMNEKPEVKMAEVELRKKDLTKDLGGEPVKKGSFEIHITKMKDGKRVGKPIFTFLKKNSGNMLTHLLMQVKWLRILRKKLKQLKNYGR